MNIDEHHKYCFCSFFFNLKLHIFTSKLLLNISNSYIYVNYEHIDKLENSYKYWIIIVIFIKIDLLTKNFIDSINYQSHSNIFAIRLAKVIELKGLVITPTTPKC